MILQNKITISIFKTAKKKDIPFKMTIIQQTLLMKHTMMMAIA